MSSKQYETCIRCEKNVMPIDNPIVYDEGHYDFPVSIWRYECSCGYSWANEDQRKHNYIEYGKQKRAAYNRARGLYE